MNTTLSIYGSHDASAVFFDRKGDLKVLEYERFVKKRYAMYSDRFDHRSGDLGTNQEDREQFIQYIKSQIDSDIDCIVYNELSDTDLTYLTQEFPKAEFQQSGHHTSHAASGYYTSGYDRAVIFSIDGGGMDQGLVSYTKVFEGSGQSTIKTLQTPNLNLGIPYGRIGCAISEINPGPDSNTDSLVYAGKVMGLCGYGSVQEPWLQAMRAYYKHHDLHRLGVDIGVPLHFDSIKSNTSYDLAATSQYVFEELMIELIQPYLSLYDNFVLVGGCALNVLFNQTLKSQLSDMNKNLYTPPNPNDCGLALGQFLLKYPNTNTNVYSGFGILDIGDLEKIVDERQATQASTKDIVKLLKKGKIIGIVEGNSEVGPRALGNRSIICDPSIDGMKDVLNAKVKFREWFRPFAPVCRLEDKDKFFDDVYECEFMSYAPNVKLEYREVLKAISHVDGTSRLQTVTNNQHSTFYKILTELDSNKDIPVILNTSFNIKGMPILTTIYDALYCLDNTLMDYVVIEGWLFKRNNPA